MLAVVVLPGPGGAQASPFTHCGEEVQTLPVGAVRGQMPAMQDRPFAQTLPQAPQFSSVVRSVQVPLQLPVVPVLGQQALDVPVLPGLGAVQTSPGMQSAVAEQSAPVPMAPLQLPLEQV